MPTQTFGTVKARRIRVTALDECGVPSTDPCAVVATDGFVRVTQSVEVEEGEEFAQKNAWGDFCVNEKDDDRIKRLNLEVEFCEVNPDLFSLLIGSHKFVNGDGDSIGFAIGQTLGTDFMLEAWTKKTGGGGCGAGGESWVYWVWPWVTGGQLSGDVELAYATTTFTVGASTKPSSEAFGQGWAADSPLPGALPAGNFAAAVLSATAPPENTDGCEPFTGGVPLATTAVAGTPGNFTPASPVARPPATKAELDTLTASPLTAWTTGQSVSAGGSPYHWDSDSFEPGLAP